MSGAIGVTRDDHGEITELLRELGSGREGALEELFEAVYGELRRLAHGQRRRWRGEETLNTTALIHEAYLKLAGGRLPNQDRGRFFAVASRAMRQILIDRARRSRAERRGGGAAPASLADLEPPAGRTFPDEELLSLDAALGRLEKLDPRQVRIVECRFFGGLGVAETAAAVGVSTATVKRDWRAARAWLYRELTAG
jgi:RNA polymerase sigma factor (TIGR02999 family)